MKMEHQKVVFRDILGVGATMGWYFKKVHDLGLSTANMDVICKSAVLNFISSLEWLDRYLPVGTQSPLKVVFRGSTKDITKLALEVCREGNSTTGGAGSDDFEALIHSNERVAIRKATYDKLHNTNEFGANAPTPPVDHQANRLRDLLTAILVGNINNNNNNNATIPPSTPPAGIATTTAVTPGGAETMGLSVENLLLLVNSLRSPIVPQAVVPPPIEPKLSPFGK